jgi:hypothetical protein
MINSSHSTARDLELWYLGEASEETEAHLANCPLCRHALDVMAQDRTAFLGRRQPDAYIRRLRAGCTEPQPSLRSRFMTYWALAAVVVGVVLPWTRPRDTPKALYEQASSSPMAKEPPVPARRPRTDARLEVSLPSPPVPAVKSTTGAHRARPAHEDRARSGKAAGRHNEPSRLQSRGSAQSSARTPKAQPFDLLERSKTSPSSRTRQPLEGPSFDDSDKRLPFVDRPYRR